MEAARAWARAEIRRTLGGTVMLVAFVGLAGAVVLTALAGARRTDTAFDRRLDEARSADVRLQYSSSAPIDDDVMRALRRHPDIEAVAPVYFTLAAAADSDYDLNVFSGPDPALFTEIDRPELLEGRRPAPAAADEVLANRFLADNLGLRVGDTIRLATFTPAQLEAEDYEEPAGPALEVTIVGISQLADEIADPELTAFLGTPAFFDSYARQAGGYGPSVEVRTRPGADPEQAVRAAIEGISFDEVVLTTSQSLRVQVEHGTHAMAVGLYLFAATAAAATVVAAGQALHRRMAGAGADQPALWALGLTKVQRSAGAAMVALPPILGGAVVALVASATASPLMPVGTARRAEPDPGFRVDLPALGWGAAGIIGSLLVVAGWSAWHISGATSHRTTVGPAATNQRVLARLIHGGSSAPIQLGLAMALEPGAGRTAVPVRSAAVGSTLGVVGVVAALTFGLSMDRLADSPARYGWNWTLAPDVEPGSFADVEKIDGVRDIGQLIHREIVLAGVQMQGIAVQAAHGSPSLTVRAGRMPAVVDEAAIGPKTAERLGIEVGDVVEATGPDGVLRLRVVGEVLFPVFNENAFNSGVALHPDAIDGLAVSDGFEQTIVTFDDGISASEAAARLEAVVPDSGSVYAFASPPPDVANLEAVQSLPPVLAAFLSLVAVAAVGHALATSVRRRRRDLGTVRAIGFVGSQVHRSVRVQATTLLAIGIVVGTPLGVATGRVAWRTVAAGLGVQAAPATPLGVVAALVPLGLVLSALLAALPGRAATALQPAEALRTE